MPTRHGAAGTTTAGYVEYNTLNRVQRGALPQSFVVLEADLNLLYRLSTHVGMSPRKKPKPNPKAPAPASAPAAPSSTAPSQTPERTEKQENIPSNTAPAESSTKSGTTVAPASSTGQTLKKKASRQWLGAGGSWRSKAPAIVKGFNESIGVGVAGGAPAEIPARHVENTKPQSPAKFLTKRKSSKGDAIPAAMTKLNVSSDGSIDERQKNEPDTPRSTEPAPPPVDDPPLPPLPPNPPKTQNAVPASAFAWRSWWSRPDGYSDKVKSTETEDAQGTPLPGPTPSEEPDAQSRELGHDNISKLSAPEEDAEMKDAPGGEAAANEDSEMKDVATPTVDESVKAVSSTS